MGEIGKKNINDEQFYSNCYQKAMSIGQYFCHTKELAQEVAQLTSIKLFLWKDKVLKPDQWIYQVARNYALQLMKSHKKDGELHKNLKHVIQAENYPNLLNKPKLESIVNDIPSAFLSDIEKKIAADYFVNNVDIKQLIEVYSLSEENINEKIYHIKQEIILYLRFGVDFKYIPKIAGTHLNSNIMYFIRKLKHSLETQNFSELKSYIDSSVELEKMDKLMKVENLVSIINYELRYLEPGIYKLFCSFLTDRKFPYAIAFIIRMTNFNKIKIISEPSLTTKVLKINRESVNDDVKLMNTRKIDGSQVLSVEEVRELEKTLKTTVFKLKSDQDH